MNEKLAQDTKLVLDSLLRADNNQLTMNELLRVGFGAYAREELNKVISSLKDLDWIWIETNIDPGNINHLVKLANEPLRNFLKWKDKDGKD